MHDLLVSGHNNPQSLPFGPRDSYVYIDYLKKGDTSLFYLELSVFLE